MPSPWLIGGVIWIIGFIMTYIIIKVRARAEADARRITYYDVLMTLIISLFSWVTLIALLLIFIVHVVWPNADEADVPTWMKWL